MEDKYIRLIRVAFREWKKNQRQSQGPHPDEEELCCFIEGRLGDADTQRVRAHVLDCNICQEAVAFVLRQPVIDSEEVPAQLIEDIRGILFSGPSEAMEIALKVKEGIMQVLKSTGDILVGQELVPASVLRSRKEDFFKDELIIFKDVKDLRIKIKIAHQKDNSFKLAISAKNRATNRAINDIKVALLKDNQEIESYDVDTGLVCFEYVALGEYDLKIYSNEARVGILRLSLS